MDGLFLNPLLTFLSLVPITPAGERYEIHTRRFSEATTKPSGIGGMMEGIRALALTGYDLFSDPGLVEEAWSSFRSGVRRVPRS